MQRQVQNKRHIQGGEHKWSSGSPVLDYQEMKLKTDLGQTKKLIL